MINKESLHKDFSKWFERTWGHTYKEESDIKAFYDSRITQILKEIVGEERIPDPDDPRYIDWAGGYNNKRIEIIEKVKEMGYETKVSTK